MIDLVWRSFMDAGLFGENEICGVLVETVRFYMFYINLQFNF